MNDVGIFLRVVGPECISSQHIHPKGPSISCLSFNSGSYDRRVEILSEKKQIFERIRDCIVSFDSAGLVNACNEGLASGILPAEIIKKGIATGTQVIGSKFEKGEFYLSELIMAGETIKTGMKVIEPHVLAKDELEASGRIVIGTVEGDVHDIGKSIVKMFLQAAGFEVTDLGVDVPANKFTREAQKNVPDVLGMSALMTVSLDQMKTVMNQLKKTRIRGKVKVIIGGAPVTPNYAEQIGADAGTNDAIQGVESIKTWITNSGH